jgi:hypothetical protein
MSHKIFLCSSGRRLIRQLKICQLFLSEVSKHMHAVITTCFAYWENTQNKLEIDIARLRLIVTNVCMYIRSVFQEHF